MIRKKSVAKAERKRFSTEFKQQALLRAVKDGVPVLARVNPNNDLVGVIESEGVGLVVAGDSPALLHAHANRLADDPELRNRMGEAGIQLAERMFSPASAAAQVIAGLTTSAV